MSKRNVKKAIWASQTAFFAMLDVPCEHIKCI